MVHVIEEFNLAGDYIKVTSSRINRQVPSEEIIVFQAPEAAPVTAPSNTVTESRPTRKEALEIKVPSKRRIYEMTALCLPNTGTWRKRGKKESYGMKCSCMTTLL